IITLAVIIAAALIVGLTFLLPVPSSWTGSWIDFHAPLAGTSIISSLNVGAAILFLVSSRIYKTQLRRVYNGIALGITITTIGSIQIPIINALSAWNSAWVNYGLIGLPFLTASLVLYFSIRALGHLVGMQSPFIQIKYALPIVVAIAVTVAFLPHAHFSTAEAAIDASNVVASICASLYGLASISVFQVSRRIGKHYARTMFWLALGIAGSSSVSIPIIINALLTGVTNSSSPSILVPELLTPILLMVAGYTFAQASQTEQSVHSGDINNMIDMITYAASLVSNPSDIDPTLDPVRSITANLGADHILTPEDKKRLAGAYLQIEQYLISKERIRVFSKEELRDELTPDLQQQIAAFEK
ncbi:MAG TPA: hypothetical protein VNG90_00765, partial [Candidatus Acidoferrum sp.]|nr:hypothetical protein [Candidatus Acidoferrum sp.]